MFDFFKKEDKTDEALIREACKRTGNMDLLKEPYFKEYMDLMMKGYDNPEEITEMCIKVIIGLAHYHDMPKHLFKDMLNYIEEAYGLMPSKEVMMSMKEFDLV